MTQPINGNIISFNSKLLSCMIILHNSKTPVTDWIKPKPNLLDSDWNYSD